MHEQRELWPDSSIRTVSCCDIFFKLATCSLLFSRYEEINFF